MPPDSQSNSPSDPQPASQPASQPALQPASESASQSATQPDAQRDATRENPNAREPTPEVKARNEPSGTHYVEPSPLGIEPVVQTGVDRQTNPPRSNRHPEQTAEVPLGTGGHPEPAGGGGRASHKN